MKEPLPTRPASTRLDKSIFTILGGTTIPDRAAVVRAECREGSRVELRRQEGADRDSAGIDVWLECKAMLGLVNAWKKIGHVPKEVATELAPNGDASPHVVAHGRVKLMYAPMDLHEAVVAVEIGPEAPG